MCLFFFLLLFFFLIKQIKKKKKSDADSESRNRFRIGANLKFFVMRMRQLYLNVNFFGHLDDSKIFKRTVLVTK